MRDRDAFKPVPTLENGDRLTLPEFERRYEAMPAIKKAELIEGEVFIPSHAGLRRHGRPHIHLVAWLGTYEAGTPGLIAACNSSVRLDLDNEVQPDVLLLIDPDRGGQARISDDDFVKGAPELVVEVAASSVSIELHKKLHVYRRSGVLEYVVWRVLDRKIDWFVQRDDEFVRLDPDDTGHYRSTTFPGLWLDEKALIEGDLSQVLDVVRLGSATPEHAKFVADLAARSSGRRP